MNRLSERPRLLITVALLSVLLLISSCHRSKPPATTRYHFTGRIVSIENQAQTALIDGDLVQGYMEAMAMTYKFKPASTIQRLSPGDAISADLVVVEHDPRDETTEQEYWLENVKVTGHAQPPPAKGTSSLHTPAPGEEVPDFSFTNQDGRHVSLRQFRGHVLFVTFIYTRCPFPDFCPRMSSNFNEIYKHLGTDPALAGAHLLSVSFDPQHDTPKVLREYAYSVAHTRNPSLFHGWEFAAPSAKDLQKIAAFFALTVKPEGGMITHNLSTAVIGPDGKIVNWYHGGDWQISDLIKDAAGASSRTVGL